MRDGVTQMRTFTESEGRAKRRRRAFDMSLEMLLLFALLAGSVSAAAAQSDTRKPWDAETGTGVEAGAAVLVWLPE